MKFDLSICLLLISEGTPTGILCQMVKLENIHTSYIIQMYAFTYEVGQTRIVSTNPYMLQKFFNWSDRQFLEATWPKGWNFILEYLTEYLNKMLGCPQV